MSYSESTGQFELWLYTPSLPLAGVTTAVFAILTVAHTFFLFRTRAWFCVPFVVGGLFEVIGYIGRCMAHSDQDSITPYIMQSLLLLLAPILFAASVYMILSRLIRATNAEHLSVIRVKWLTKIFVGGDVLCFMIQGGGGGMLSTADSVDDIKLGENIILGGLILQVIIFGVFLTTAAIFHSRLRKDVNHMSTLQVPWERLMWTLYIASLLISLRNIFRVIEYGMGGDGYLLRHEWTLYIFDALPMAVVLLVCLIIYKIFARRVKNTSIESAGVSHEVETKGRR